jgi:hypothetical protein
MVDGGCEWRWLGRCELSEFKAKPMHIVDVDFDDAAQHNKHLACKDCAERNHSSL